ncbi:MAG: hypothetical protein L0Y73_05605, partial [Candidatus Aminicenantes bacterium]|nr:hypothetical protein [Candidatus Aminicenantes bacterium]
MKRRNENSEQGGWFFLYPYVHLNVKAGKVVIYNTLSSVLLEYDSPGIVEMITPLYRWETSVIDTGNWLCDVSITAMIEDVRNSFSGDLIAKSLVDRKPFQFQPKLFFNDSHDPEYRDYSLPILNSEQPKDYLEELSIYISSRCGQKCRECKAYYKQTYFCTADSGGAIFPFDDLKQLLKQAQKTALKRVNLLGGDIFLYPEISELISFLNDYPAGIYYYNNHRNLNSTSIGLINSINREKDMCVVLVNPPFTESPLDMLLDTCNLETLFFTFLVSSEKEYDNAAAFIDKYSLEQVSVVPIYIPGNESFFEQNVFVTRESIVEEPTDILSILQRNRFNEAGIKKLFVKSDKKIFSNPNLPAIA